MAAQWVALDVVDPDQWDPLIGDAPDGTVFQTTGWGRHRRRAGWMPVHWAMRDGRRTLALAQVLQRAGPLGVRIGWCPGGPVVGFGMPDRPELARRLLSFVSVQRRGTYLRFDSYLPRDLTLISALGGVVARPRQRVNTGVTTILDLTASQDEFLSAMKQKHRYNLRRALKLPIVWRRGGADEAASLARLQAEMIAAKRITARRPSTADAIADLCYHLGANARILIGSLGGRDVVGCLVLVLRDRAFLHTPATGADRSTGVAYAMLDVLVRDLRAAGVRILDLAGLDPDGRTLGVDRFKTGFGGPILERLGEWEWADPWILRLAVDAALVLRGRAFG